MSPDKTRYLRTKALNPMSFLCEIVTLHLYNFLDLKKEAMDINTYFNQYSNSKKLPNNLGFLCSVQDVI